MSSRSQAKAFRQAGLPLLLLVGGGFYGLSYMLQGNLSVKVHFAICILLSVAQYLVDHRACASLAKHPTILWERTMGDRCAECTGEGLGRWT